MSAIKKFFEHQRKVAANREAYYKRKEQEMNNPKPEVIDTSAFDKEVEYYDFLLKRCWALDRESMIEFLMEADEDVFQELVKRSDTYPRVIQEAIHSFLPSPLGNIRLKVRDITDKEMDLQEFKEQQRRRQEMSDAWEAYKNEQKLEPPAGDLESELHDMVAQLQQLNKKLEEARKKSLTGRYVPPAMRDKLVAQDPRVLEINKQIEKVENEITYQNHLIEQEHNEWFMRKRNEFEQKMLSM